MMTGSLLSKMFEINYGALFRNLEGITHDESFIEPPAGNCLNWVLGHMVATRNRLLPLVRVQPIWSREQAYRYSGRDNAGWSRATATHLDSIKTDLVRSQQQLLTALESMSDKELAAPSYDGRPLAEVLSFFQFHETYHAGQIALLRRIIGKPGVIKPSAPRPSQELLA